MLPRPTAATAKRSGTAPIHQVHIPLEINLRRIGQHPQLIARRSTLASIQEAKISVYLRGNIFRGCATTPGIEKKFAFLQWWCRAAKKPLDQLNGKARDKLTFFPRFYSSQIPTDAERQAARRLKISNLLRASNDFFSYGHVPRALSVALVTVGVDKLYVKDAVDQIQAAIAWTGSRCWAMRCKFFWDQKKEREKQLREQERLQRVAAYRERLEEEERQHLAMLARRVQLAAQQSRAENDERDADMERVAENDDNFPT
jgi:hypothetical protein